MNHEYLTIDMNLDARAFVIKDIGKHVRDSWELKEGISLKGRINESIKLSMAPDGGDMLCDFPPSPEQALIVSSKARDLLESEGLQEGVVEYLPFTLLDKRRKPARTRFFFANVLLKLECMDRKASQVSKIDSGELVSVKRLHLRLKDIPEGTKLFRLAELPKLHVIRSDLVQRIREAGLIGLEVLAQGERIF